MDISPKQEWDSKRKLSIVRVALLAPLRSLFDYLPPQNDNGTSVLLPGLRVKVPFGRQEKIGVIIDTVDYSDVPVEKLKSILEVLDEEPLFSKPLFQLIEWAANYYQCSLGEMLKTAIPGWLRKGKKSKIDLKYSNAMPSPKSNAHILNAAQQLAVTTVHQAFNTFQTFLLEGITGSGKTEVYAYLIEQALQASKQVLILVPEIGLTPQIIKRFETRFQVPIASLHSTLTDKQRYHAWCLAKTGIAPIVVGTRSAVFTPLQNPGLFIMDEEHDISFKQQEGVRYSARDLLILRGQKENCPVLLGTATPSLETVHNVKIGRYQKLMLPTRPGNAQSPRLHILDIRHKKLEEGLSAQLLGTIKEHLTSQGQVLLFLNRRGFAPVYMCFDCGWIQHCIHCDAKMTLHKKHNRLSCHHCLTNHPIPQQCPQCQASSLHPIGIGTQRLESALQKLFPDHKILRIDRDTTQKKGDLNSTLIAAEEGHADILIGTQMIAKGHHFPHVTLVGILDVDGALFSVDFRSLERMGQLITQVAGRAGRAERLGTVMLQTCHPEHPLLNLLLEKGYPAFADILLQERKEAKLPPYHYHALIRADAKKAELGFHFLDSIKTQVVRQKMSNLSIWGPVQAPMERRAGYHRAQLLFQSPDRQFLHRTLRSLIETIDHFSSKTIRWSIDIDPLDMY